MNYQVTIPDWEVEVEVPSKLLTAQAVAQAVVADYEQKRAYFPIAAGEASVKVYVAQYGFSRGFEVRGETVPIYHAEPISG